MKPVAGYPSRTAFVIDRLAAGQNCEAIANDLEQMTGETVTPKMIMDLETSRRRENDRKVRRAADILISVCDGDAIDVIAMYAGVAPARLHDAMVAISNKWPSL